jgi:glycosyltransferase EpsH
MISPKISIIVPVYNDQDRIGRAIKSALEQTLKEIELIVIDDGSSDRTPEILAEYAKRDERLVILQGKRLGAYGCRNLGLKRATGRYIGFLDSDDWVEPNMFQDLLESCEVLNADISMCSSKHFIEKDGTFHPHCSFQGWARLTLINETNIDRVNGALWNKLYRRDHLAQANLKFGPYQIAADTAFNWKYFLLFPKVAIVPDELYIYNLHENSLVTKKQGKTSLNVIDVFVDIQHFLEGKGLFPLYRSAFYRFISPHLIKRVSRERVGAFHFIFKIVSTFGLDYLMWNASHLGFYLPKLKNAIKRKLS